MSVERRETFRFNLQPEMREARLIVGGKELPAEVTEQSAGGFRVKLARGVQVRLNDVVELHCVAGQCMALVVHLEEINNVCRLGLQRLEGRPPKPSLRARIRALLPRRKPPIHWQRKANKRRRAVFVLSAAGLCLAAAGLSWLVIHAPGSPKERTRRSFEQTELTGFAAEQLHSSGAETKEDAADAAKKPATIGPDVIAALERLSSLQATKTVNALDLSEAQKLQISRLLAETMNGMRQLQTRRGSVQSRVQLVGERAAASTARALEILTPEQRARWQSESPKADKSGVHPLKAAGPTRTPRDSAMLIKP